ncbi:DNA polymerase thumb domain-containing protein [Acidianus manzaensis]|uniref:DNA-directed DNA polymerase n=1 Tax=Acidianus manzaensis TaxID=282676 RepID=A0A1W6JXU3_9CREN|nr:DNA polymerase IV [Acidianus manzaensis]ARM75083.1 DNA polymerase IV [Acidianus manzaensis]
MIVLFVDFDYFFAQVEEILNPKIKGKPVAVCVFSGRFKDSGAIATSNYEARKLGIKAGMPIPKAKEIAPNAIYLPIRKEIYKEVSNRIMDGILKNYGDKIEIASIDEAYLDITQRVKDFREAYILGKEIKDKIYEKEKITVTVGIAPNKILAKIVAELHKPNGLGVLKPEEVESFIKTLPIDEVPGVGNTILNKLKENGISYLYDVTKVDFEKLKSEIGKAKASYLYSLALNTYNEPVKERIRKHIGRYVTMKNNSRDLDFIYSYLKRAIDEAYSRANGGIPKTLAVVAIMEDLDIVSREKTYNFGITRENAYDEAKLLLAEILKSDRRKLRRVGVRLGKIYKASTLDKFFNF